jgi:hypothetical protein
MATNKITNWALAIEVGKKHPSGLVTGVHGQTLRAMEKADLVYRSGLGDWILSDKAYEYGEEKAEPVQPEKVTFEVLDHGRWRIPLKVTGVLDMEFPLLPGSGTIRASHIELQLTINPETGKWEASTVHVTGKKVKDGKVIPSKRDHTLPTSIEYTPQEIRDICQRFVDKANSAPEEGFREAAQLLEDTGRDDDAVNLLRTVANARESGGFKDIDEALEQARVPDAFPDYDVKGAVARVAQRVEKGLTIEPASYSFQARPVDVGAGTPGDLYVNVLGKLHSLGSLGRAGFSVQYYLGTTIDFEWDTDLGALVIDTPENFMQPVISASADGKLAVRIEGKRRKGA